MARRKTRMTLREIATTAALLLVVCWLVLLLIGIFKKEERARTTVTQTRAELAALDARKGTLADTVYNMDSERGHEASLRETFGVARPGEDVIIVVPKKEMAPPPEPTFWDKVREFFSF